MITVTTVRAIIIDKESRVLFGLRARGLEKGKWGLIGGKKKLTDKTNTDAVIREVEEELGVIFQPKHYKLLKGRQLFPGIDYITYFFTGTIEGNIKVKKDEITKVEYFSKQELEKRNDIAFEHKEVVLEYLEEQKTNS